MDYNALVSEVSNKYSYNEELQIAIRLTLPLMVKEYGEERIPEICDLFRKTRIFATDDMSEKSRKNIENIMLSDINKHITFDDGEDPYQTDVDPGSYYSYEAVYDEEMNIVDEVRWVAVKDMQNGLSSEQYKNLFGTTINMPYFIHEINHAFVMQNPTYRKEGDKIFSKHGMVEQEISITNNDGKTKIKNEITNNIIIEEAINEKITQDMLVELMQVNDYKEATRMLVDINHIPNSYSPVLISLADKLENVLGKDNLLKWRMDNDKSVLQEFNTRAIESDIAKKYFEGLEPYDYFDKKCFGIFLLKCNCYKMTQEEYSAKTKELMVDAFTPLCAYQDKKLGTMSLEKFESIRNSILGIEITNEKNIDEGSKGK